MHEKTFQKALARTTDNCREKLLNEGIDTVMIADLSDEDIRTLREAQRCLVQTMDHLFDPKIIGRFPSSELRMAALQEIQRLLVTPLQEAELPSRYKDE